jgi:Zn-dependent M28 family amino/carboxypeptidase
MAAAKQCKPYVESEALQDLITIEDLVAGSQRLQDIADAHGGNRAFGGGGHNATVDWLYETLEATEYFDVVKQPFSELFHTASASMAVDGEKIASLSTMTYTPGGSVTGPIIRVPNLGCNGMEYPAEVAGNIALVSRGTCSFGEKSLNAKKAGAAAVIVYNNEPGPLSATLGTPLLDYAPSVSLSQEDGQALVAALEAGEVTAELIINAVSERRVNYNVIAETKGGDHDNVLILGGHSDSVYAGPGIK